MVARAMIWHADAVMLAQRPDLKWKKQFDGASIGDRVVGGLLLISYAIAFAGLHWSSSPWAGAGFFSLWYPAAGLRFAVLWSRGVRLVPWLALAEITADWCTGVFTWTSPELLGALVGMVRPSLTCGLAIVVVRRLALNRKDALAFAPMTMGLAAICAPLLNSLFVIPIEALLPAGAGHYRLGLGAIVSLTGLGVGDLLGILVLSPALLWLSAIGATPFPWRMKLPPARPILADSLVIAACLLFTVELWQAGLGVQPAPMLLAGAWVGLRHGRVGAWLAVLLQIIVFLPYSADHLTDAGRLELHLGLAAVVLITWLAGSFADAQSESRAALERRNRLLFQADRLKTLRAMSVAVIHEISQPLSTLAIEAGHLRDLTKETGGEISESAVLIDRKARDLSELVRRLRRFGGRDVDEPSAVPISMLLRTASQIVAPELRSNGQRLDFREPAPDLVVQAQEVELTQAIVNLLRNAMAGSLTSAIHLHTHADDQNIYIEVINTARATARAFSGSGMGVGLAIARTIIEAHGGSLVRETVSEGVRFLIILPALSGPMP